VETEDARRLLDEERERLEEVRGGFDAEHLHDESEDDSRSELSHLAMHQADVGSDTFEREKDFSILEQVEAELADVDRALVRLDDGSYGTCEICGAAIDDARLADVPATRWCGAHDASVPTPSA
jgi:RNA polymerase-binding transcription factor DksA